MSSIKNRVLLLLVFLIAGCDRQFSLVSKSVDYFFTKNRIKTFCSRSIIELYELSTRINDQKNTKINFFFTANEFTTLNFMEEDIKKIYLNNENSKKDFEYLLSIEEKIKQRLSNGNTLISCINSIQMKKKCKQAEGNDLVDCINQAQRLFTINKILGSEVTQLFPQSYLHQINQEKSNLKSYFQN